MDGTIARLVRDRGFGFIRDANSPNEYFFHRTGLRGVQFTDLTEHDAVRFDLQSAEKGPKAVNITKR